MNDTSHCLTSNALVLFGVKFSHISRVIAIFVSKFLNFRYRGKEALVKGNFKFSMTTLDLVNTISLKRSDILAIRIPFV